MNRKKIISIVLGLMVAAFFLRGCFAGPEKQIREQLLKLEELVTYDAGEGNLSSLTKVKQLGGLFAEDVEIELHGFSGRRSVRGRSEVQQAAMAARSQVKSLQADLYDITVYLAEDNQSATVEATGRGKLEGERSSLIQEFVFIFENTPEGWLITKVETPEALR